MLLKHQRTQRMRLASDCRHHRLLIGLDPIATGGLSSRCVGLRCSPIALLSRACGGCRRGLALQRWPHLSLGQTFAARQCRQIRMRAGDQRHLGAGFLAAKCCTGFLHLALDFAPVG